ncbi:MAG: hypothetical protein R3A11_01035 [Bdellovibrionota bacterium]
MIKAFSAFPSVTRDLAFVVSKDVDAAQVQKAIQSAKVSCLTKVEVFDHYEGKPLSKSEKSLAFALEFSDLEKTLKDSEIDKAIAKITERVEKDCNARLR